MQLVINNLCFLYKHKMKFLGTLTSIFVLLSLHGIANYLIRFSYSVSTNPILLNLIQSLMRGKLRGKHIDKK